MKQQNEEAAPSGGVKAPDSPTSSNKVNDFRYAARELGDEFDGLDPEDYLKEPITSFEPLDQKGGPRTSAPVFIDVEDSEDGSLKGKVLNTVANRQKMRNPDGSQYKGELKDRPIRLRRRGKNNNRTLDDILLKPFAQSQGGPSMGGMGL